MDLDQIVDDEGWQLSMNSTGGCSNSSMLPLDAEALRVFEDEEGGWKRCCACLAKESTSRSTGQ